MSRRSWQIIEKLSVIAPAGDVKLKLLKEIAAEHNLDWDPSDTEAELLKTHEDLLVRLLALPCSSFFLWQVQISDRAPVEVILCAGSFTLLLKQRCIQRETFNDMIVPLS